jgi:excisionase family DNA binding protein
MNANLQFDEMYTPEEVAKAFKVTAGTVRNLIKKGRLFAYQIGDQYRIPRFAIDQWLSPFAGIDWESIGYGAWKNDPSTSDPEGFVKKIRKTAHKSVKDYLADLDRDSSSS